MACHDYLVWVFLNFVSISKNTIGYLGGIPLINKRINRMKDNGFFIKTLIYSSWGINYEKVKAMAARL